jgi:hypothetical protein
VESAHVIEDAHLASINSEYINSGDGNNNSPNHKFFSNLINRKTTNSKSNLLFYTTCAFSSFIIFIQLSEIYFYEQDYLSEKNKRSLITQKIRLNN